MWKRVIFLLVSLAVLVGMGLFTSAAIAGKPAEATFTPINTFEGIEFSTMDEGDEGWIDLATKFEDELAIFIKKMRNKGDGYVPTKDYINQVRQECRQHKSWAFQVYLSDNEANHAAYRLGIRMSDDVKLQLNGVGCFSFKLQLPDSNVITVIDQGVLCPEDKPIRKWISTKKKPVEFTTRFNDGAPGTWPNYVYVMLPRSVIGAKVLEVRPTDKMQIVSPSRTAMFK